MLASTMIISRILEDTLTRRRPELQPPRRWIPEGDPGTVLDTESLPAIGLRGAQTATRIEYVTRDSRDRPVTASATVFRSGRPGPLIGFAPSTQGVARHCNHSYSCTVGMQLIGLSDAIAAYEQVAVVTLLDSGADVVVLDYPRDPDMGVQMYCDHPAGANALEDAVTAARHLGADGDLGLWGFSQGGGTIGAYLESSAPQPVAAVVGAPPVDLGEVLRHVDGSMITGVVAYTLGGLMSTSAEIKEEIVGQLTDDGLDALLDNLTRCTAGAVKRSGWTTTSSWSKSGRPFGELVEEMPAVSAEIDRRRLGTADVRVPVRLWANSSDDIIPFFSIERLHRQWPSAEWDPRRWPQVPGRFGLNHFAPYYRWLADDARWLLAQFPVG